ncbi:MAG: DUF3179 domain-containing protein [Chloroflexi bacterium]|nr:DUF3179 domain-containing protein [Chloroflexota bacterium]
MISRLYPLAILLVTSLILVACGSDSAPTPLPQSSTTSAVVPTKPRPEGSNPRIVDDNSYYINFLVSRDGILPIYEPVFVTAAESPFHDDELVIAVSINGESKAYPISVLRGREMVNDELAGTPILVTW